MNNTSTLFHLSMFFISLSLSPMEYTEYDSIHLEPIYLTKTTTNTAIDTLVNSIDTAINKKHGTNNVITDTFASLFLSEEKMLDIINTVDQYSSTQNINPALLDALYTKNSYFKKTVDHFSEIALQNINGVTCLTLSTIEKPYLQQPKPQLNQCAPAIKHYVITKALSQIEHSYDIKLTGHTDTIVSFDISSNAHLAATGSTDQTTRIWDLKTGKQTHLLEKILSCRHSFNPDGSRITTVYYYPHLTTNIIKEWDTRSGDLLWSTEEKGCLVDIEYLQNSPHNIIAIRGYNYYPITQSLYLLNGNNRQLLGTIQSKPINYNYEPKARGEYYAKNPSGQITDDTTLFIKKTKCSSLYLCQKAINNTKQATALTHINNSESYQALTDYEKDMIQRQIQEKTAALLLMKKQEKHLNKYLDSLGL